LVIAALYALSLNNTTTILASFAFSISDFVTYPNCAKSWKFEKMNVNRRQNLNLLILEKLLIKKGSQT
jgi:hypothetical protein